MTATTHTALRERPAHRLRPTGYASLDYAIFLACAGAIALHVIDDSFLQPQPGTAAADHLVSGLVPLAMLALAALVFPRSRAGARAAIALPLAALGIVGGLEAVHYWREVALSGDDYTGLLAIPAGLALLGLAAVTLWRSRRLDDRCPWRYGRRALIGVAGVTVTLQLVVPLGMGYAFTHLSRAEVPPADLGAPHRDVTLETSDGLELEGWYVPSRNGAAVIAFPGRKGPQNRARMLVEHGYGVLLFDRRGEGASDGDGNAFGWGGDKDILAAIEFLERRPDVDAGRIGGIGLSVGGELMLQAAAEGAGLDAVVSDGAGTRSAAEQLDGELSGAGKWLALPFVATVTAATAVFSDSAPPAKLIDLMPRIAPRPVLLIQSTGADNETMNPSYHRAAREPKQLWRAPADKHMGAFEARPEEYERRVVGFFDRALLELRTPSAG
ncbi:MAG TPA: CocE/NonD family hydrolase [Thermoleophilaceae bacterium]|nr:CocE/NonD family hydrolase [Thermoleophilaceae bacterium]